MNNRQSMNFSFEKSNSTFKWKLTELTVDQEGEGIRGHRSH